MLVCPYCPVDINMDIKMVGFYMSMLDIIGTKKPAYKLAVDVFLDLVGR